jgi:hypothetical protein
MLPGPVIEDLAPGVMFQDEDTGVGKVIDRKKFSAWSHTVMVGALVSGGTRRYQIRPPSSEDFISTM